MECYFRLNAVMVGQGRWACCLMLTITSFFQMVNHAINFSPFWYEKQRKIKIRYYDYVFFFKNDRRFIVSQHLKKGTRRVEL